MNDVHNNDVLDHPFHGRFWVQNPSFFRQGATGYFANALDYAHPEVRDLYRRLIEESLTYDVDGIELDFMREPHVFSPGQEAAGLPVLTEWLREIRRLVRDTAAKRGRPVRLGVRVPSRPETARAYGLDPVGWAQEGLVDLVVPTPRWATLEFDMPLAQWRRLLQPYRGDAGRRAGDPLSAPPGRPTHHRRPRARLCRGGGGIRRRGRRGLPVQLLPGQ